MPIYAYKCSACGHAKDVLQKISDAPLTVCPSCGAAAFAKQVTAAGFQLKGSGWYVTDFRDGGGKGGKGAGNTAGESTGTASGGEAAAPAAAPAPAAASPAPAPAAAPAPGTSSS
ncbi:FmdB family zinc ribbon protein [Pseudorhodoferax sp.]|uniref:FmdB family zinc ribbon protein n=1 Tax=Pseudorhodoferax sp. TaxID=1993553 RepID=UPI0039E6CB0D